jgi:uncharacterized protein (DUF433 family)
MTTVMDGHIVVDDRGIARIEGSRIKVMHLVMEMQSNGLTIEELHEWFPHLSRYAMHAAFAYYYDHQKEVDEQIQASAEFAERIRLENPNHITRAELERRRGQA